MSTSLWGTGPLLALELGSNTILDRKEIDYCTVEQIKGWLLGMDLDLHGTIDDPEADFKIIRTSVKRQINNHCKQEFDLIRRSEFASGDSGISMFTRYYPIAEFEFVRMYSLNYQFWQQFSGSEMIVIAHAGEIRFPTMFITSNPGKAIGASLYGLQFFPGIKNIQMVYTSGFRDDAVPSDFSEATAQWCAGMLLRSAHLRMSDGMKSRIVSGVQENYGGYWDIGTQYIEDAKTILARYRRVTIM